MRTDEMKIHKFRVERIQIKNGGWMAFAASGNSQRIRAAAEIEWEPNGITENWIFLVELSWVNAETHFYIVPF